MSIFSSYKKIFLLGFIIVILIAIPFSVYIAQQRQNISSKATPSTTLSFDPAATTVKSGDIVVLNVMLDPGSGTSANQVSFVKLSINFDPAKFTTITKTASDESLTPNLSGNMLNNIIDDAQYDNTLGKAGISLSIGADPANAIKTKTKIAILKLKATSETTPSSPNITFDFANSQVLSIDNSSQTSDNVLLSSTIPATVTVTAGASATSSPSPAGLTCTSLSTDRTTTGTAPYPITFTVIGNTSSGTINKISFNFGDGPIQDLTTGGGIGTNSVNAQISHSYASPGTFTAYAILTDNNNNLSAQQANCSKTITINSAGLGSGSTQTVINTGGSLNFTSPELTTPSATIIPFPAVLPPTGPGNNMLGIGAIGIIFAVIGGTLLILL